MGVIKNSAIYINKVVRGQLSGLYYLISRKNYLEDKNTWEPVSIVMHFWKMISPFHKNYLKKLIAKFLPIDSASLMGKPSTKSFSKTLKQKQS